MTDPRIQELRRLLPQAMLTDWVRLGSRLVRLLRDHHHPDAHEAILNRLLTQARESVRVREQRSINIPKVTYPAELPITVKKDEIVQGIRQHQVLVIAGETGSGKTTQLPKMCLEAGLGIEAKIGCTQPRRIAAVSVSRRIAEELGVEWGRGVGCKIRFDDWSSPETYIKLMTDGMLLAETQGDPLLSEYNALIIDEAHERSLNIDFLLGYLKGLLAKRPELKLIISSATIDTKLFSEAFGNAPVIEVSGRLYPVEVVYAPFDQESEESGEKTYIDAAVEAAGRTVAAGPGDVLIFMPSERDIRETADQLEPRFGPYAEIIPLFGRLTTADQQRAFAPSARRKIVVATNIAETSLTIPGIRYVIDTGLARISRYNPRTRTKRLPIEPVSQSSADQRKGRSGRVQAGICIRLFSEEDVAARPRFTQPEIQRANLAEVILRMKAFQLGEIETFPFLNAPSPAAIHAGYALLQELGALDSARELTTLGKDLARLPIDPSLGRMLLEAQRRHATRELLIIAAGLSIQDPRERPLAQKDAAAAAHRQFDDPRSDFLSLLKLWNAVHEQWETLRTQNQRRKFCRAHFLSYVRMREWQDLHAQLEEALEELGNFKVNESNADYDAIHRSILAGLLGHVGSRTERNRYQAVRDRQVMIFPGSALFDRVEKKGALPASQHQRGRRAPADSPGQPEWIVAGEIVETSQVFARTIAGIQPEWIIELAPHLCRATYHDPHWSAGDGQVVTEERLAFYGLEVRKKKVAYGNINPKEATELFIRSALVEGNLLGAPAPSPAPLRLTPGDDAGAPGAARPRTRGHRPRPRVAQHAEERTLANLAQVHESTASGHPFPARFRFLEHNDEVRHKIETWQTRARRHDLVDLDQALFRFYAQRLENVSSVADLDRFLRESSDPKALCATEADLVGSQDLSFDAEAFPDTVRLGGQSVPVTYAYRPGEEEDGVTLKLDYHLAHAVAPATVEWAVPGLREAYVSEWLRGLPKALRRQLMPLDPKVAEISRELRPSGKSLSADLARFIHRQYGVEVPAEAWPEQSLPVHLRPRFEILGQQQQPLAVGRNLGELARKLQQVKVAPPGDPPAWARAAAKWERFGLKGWTFGDFPERIEISEPGSTPVFAWPGLELEDGHINLRLFRSPEAARRASFAGERALVELALHKDLAWVQKDLRALVKLEPLLGGLCSSEQLQASALENVKRRLLPEAPLPRLAEAEFKATVERARTLIPGLVPDLVTRIEAALKLRWEILRRYAPAPAPNPTRTHSLAHLKLPGTKSPSATRLPFLASELSSLVPGNFLEVTPFDRLPHLPRYLKALQTRAERASLNRVKDHERAARVAPYVEALNKLRSVPSESRDFRWAREEFRWMLEEFKVSLFAQELGTAVPVSPKRLDQELEHISKLAKGTDETV